MIKNFFIIVILLMTYFTGFTQPIRLPYDDSSGWMLVNLNINDQAMVFLFDTGWDGLAIKSSLLPQFREGKEIAVVDANRVVAEVTTIQVDSMKVGNYTFYHLPFTDLESFPMMKDPIFNCYGIDGILGNVIYQDKILEINPIKKEILLHDITDELLTELDNNHFIKVNNRSEELRTRIVIPATINGLRTNYLMDTGDNGYLTATLTPIALNRLSPNDTNRYVTAGSVGAFGMDERLSYTFINRDAEVEISDLLLENEEVLYNSTDKAHQMGVEFIKQFYLFYNPITGILYLKKVKKSEVQSTLEKVGFGIAFIDGDYRIAALSEFEENLKLGDRVIAINNIPMSELCGYRKYIQGLSNKPKIKIERNGVEFVF
ncbi:aspartyl protease family protein [Myroides injenensis]|uniref:aspartyl protease family protein n=1 Tax=Myroides injenensis TaxID=1183151 RepID=UPI00028842F4|nr:aspartyl protease family protein [Myroides injenensis]